MVVAAAAVVVVEEAAPGVRDSDEVRAALSASLSSANRCSRDSRCIQSSPGAFEFGFTATTVEEVAVTIEAVLPVELEALRRCGTEEGEMAVAATAAAVGTDEWMTGAKSRCCCC